MGCGILLSSGGFDSNSFMIHGIFKYSFFGHEVWITNTHVSILIILILLTVFAILVGNKFKKAEMEPKGLQNVAELIVEFLDGIVDKSMGKAAPRYYNYIGTLFVFILVSNISGLLGLRPPTADYGVTLPMGILTFILVHYAEVRYTKPKDLWKDKCSPMPPWLPINIISDLAVPISLSLRLFANVLSGTIMMALVYGLLKWIALAWPAALHVYFDLFSGAIQTYVFCMLTMTYNSNARGDA